MVGGPWDKHEVETNAERRSGWRFRGEPWPDSYVPSAATYTLKDALAEPPRIVVYDYIILHEVVSDYVTIRLYYYLQLSPQNVGV